MSSELMTARPTLRAARANSPRGAVTPSVPQGPLADWSVDTIAPADAVRLEATVRRYMGELGFRNERAVRSALAVVQDRTGHLQGEERLKAALMILADEFAGRVSGEHATAECRVAGIVSRRIKPVAPQSAANPMPRAKLRSPFFSRLRRLARRVNRLTRRRPVVAGPRGM